MLQIIGTVLCAIVYLICMSSSSLPNPLGFIVLAPIAMFTQILEPKTIYGVLAKSTVHMLLIVSCYSALLGKAKIDIPVSKFVNKVTGNVSGKKRERVIMAILIVVIAVLSFVLNNNYTCYCLLPVLFAVSKRYKISHSKLLLIAIYAATLGGSCTLIGTSANIYANGILEEAGYETFKLFDYIYTGLPVLICGVVYMVFCDKLMPKKENEQLPEEYQGEYKEENLTPGEKKKMLWTVGCFGAFVACLVVDSVVGVSFEPELFGYLTLAVLAFCGAYKPEEVMKSFKIDFMFRVGTTLLFVAVISASGVTDYVGGMLASALQGQTNMYIISATLFAFTVVLTSFVNNNTCVNILVPVAVSVAQILGASPQAFVMTVNVAATCSFLTPMASGTNYGIQPYTNLTLWDFVKAGLPLAVFSGLACIFICPMVFPYF